MRSMLILLLGAAGMWLSGCTITVYDCRERAAGIQGGCPPCESEKRELAGWWKLDEKKGTIATDSSTHNNPGVVKGNPVWQNDGGKGSLVMDGEGDYVDIGNPPELQFTRALTVMAWVKFGERKLEWQAIVSKGNNSWRLYRHAAGPEADQVHLGMNGLTQVDITGIRSIGDGQWHHVAAVYDPDYANKEGPHGRMFIYIDGEEDISVPVYGRINPNGYSVAIGANSQMMDRKHRGSCLSGAIADVRIYNYAWRGEVIAATYAETRR